MLPSFIVLAHKQQAPTMEDVEKFQVGKYGEQDESVKDAWYNFGSYFLPCAHKAWQKVRTRRTALMSNATSVSDEAYVFWVLTKYIPKWEKEFRERDESLGSSMKGKQKREHHSNETGVKDYVTIYKRFGLLA